MSGILSAGSKALSNANNLSKNTDFDPTQISNLRLWLRADLGISLSSNNVTSWSDQSGNGFNMSQGASSQQPIFIPSGKNQKPAVRFDGVDDFLLSSSNVLTGTGDFSIVVVCQRLSGTNDNHVCGNYSSTNTGGIQCWVDASGRIALFITANVSGTTVIQPMQMVIMFWQRSSGAVTLRLNETNEASGTLAASIAGSTNWALGNYAALLEPFNGEIYEHMVFNKALTENERMQISNYLRQRYNIG